MSLTISAGQVDALIANPSSISGYSASGPIIITGAITYTQANNLNAIAATYIQATISETSISNLSGIAVNNSTRASLNKFSFVVSDTSASAAQLNSVQALTSVAVDASNVASITASTSADLTTLYTATTTSPVPTGISTSTPISVSDTTINATTLNTLFTYSGKVTTTATTIEGSGSQISAALAAADTVVSHPADIAVTVTDTTVSASDVDAVEGLTTGLVTVSSAATSITGNLTDISNAFTHNAANGEITGLAGLNITLEAASNGTLPSAANVVTAIGLTTGTVTATVLATDNALANFAGITGTGHALTITALDDASMGAAALAALDASTTTTITLAAGNVAGASPTITSSSYADLVSIFSSSGISGLGASNITASGTLTVAEANTLDAYTTGVVTAAISTTDVATLKTLTANTGATGNAYTYTVTDAAVTAADLNTLAGLTATAGGVTASIATSVTGTAAEVNAVYVTNFAKFTGITNEAVTITDTALDAGLVEAIDAVNTGTISLAAATSISGSATDVNSVFTKSAASNGMASLPLTTPVTITGTTINAATLKAIAGTTAGGGNGSGGAQGQTSGLVTISSEATSISGDQVDVLAAYTANTPAVTSPATAAHVTGLNNLAVTISGDAAGNALTLAEFTAISRGFTTGVITATIEKDTLADLINTTTGINSGHAVAVSISDTTVNTEDLVTLAGLTTGAVLVDGTSATTFNGTLADATAIYSASNITTAGIADANVNLDAITTAAAADLKTIADSMTGGSGDLDIANVGRISGLIADVNAVLADAEINSKGTQNVTITDATVSATALTTLIGDVAGNSNLTTGNVDVISSTISGTATEVAAVIDTAANGGDAALFTASGTDGIVSGLDAINVTLTASTAIADTNAVAGMTTGIVTATISTTSAADIASTFTEAISSSFAGHNLTLSIAGTDLAASDLVTLETLTTGTITLTGTSPLITGNASNVASVLGSTKITGFAASNVVVTGGITVAQLNAITTSGTVTATVSDGDMATLSGITTARALAITVTDASVSATALTALDAKTTGQLNVAATSTLTGTLAEVTAALGATGTITGVGAMLVSVTGSITVAEANALALLTSSAVTATITETDLASLITLETGNSWITTVATQVAEDTTTTAVELDTVISAANLATLDGLTDQVVTVTAPTIDGSLAEVTAAFTANTAGTITGLETKAITIVEAAGITLAEAQAADGLSTGVLTATVSDGDILTIGTVTQETTAVGVNGVATETNPADGQAGGTGTDAVGGATYGTASAPLATVTTSGTGSGLTVTVSKSATGTYDVASIVSAGSGYTVGDTVTVLGTLLGGATTANDLVITVASLANTRTAATNYDAVASEAVNGTGATFNVDIDANGDATVALVSGGSGYLAGETITIKGGLIGGTNGNGDITFPAPTVGANSIAAFIATTTDANNVTTFNTESGNALTITFDDASIAAADLLTANSLTTGLITLDNGGAAGTLTGNTTDLVAVYAASALTTPTITGIADYALTISNAYTVDANGTSTNDGILLAADLKSLDDSTTGVITIDKYVTDGTNDNTQQTITTLSGTYSDVHDVLTADKVTQATVGAEAGLTGGVTTATIDGLLTVGAFASGTAGAALTVTLTDTSVSVANVNDIVDSYTNIPANTVGASTIPGQEGIGAVTATITETDMTTLGGLTATAGVFTISVADASVAAADLTTLNAKTTGLITVTSTTLTGTRTAIDTALGTATTLITGLAAINATQSDAATVDQVNVTAALTTGALTASISNTDLATLGGINETGNVYTMTVADASIDAATVNVLNAKTTGVVTLSATAVTGALSDIKALYDANTAGEVTGLGNETITISDTGAISADDLNHINALTTGVVTATTATSLSGSLSELLVTYSDSNLSGIIAGLSSEALTVSDTGSVSAADLNTLNGKTSGTVTVNATTLTGSYSDVNTAYTATGLSGLGNEAIVLTGSSTVSQVNALDALTTGVVTATISANDIDSLESLTGTGNAYTISVTDATVTAAKLTALDAKTTGTITVSSTTVTGTVSELTTAYASTGITGLGSEAITVDSGVSITSAEVNTLAALTTGTLTATVSDGDMTTLKTISESGNALSATVTDASVAAVDLTTLDAGTTSPITVQSGTLTGTNAEQLAAYAAHKTGTITGLDSIFDASSYLASHADLLNAFGSNTVSAKSHFFDYGINEARSIDSFEEKTYLASYSDLLAAFGTDTSAATSHYVNYGFSEGRATDAFDELGYVASYSDLISALGASSTAATDHYINYGYSEGRSTSFDASSYLAAHSDLQTAFGTDLELAKQHYINYGYSEGRVLA